MPNVYSSSESDSSSNASGKKSSNKTSQKYSDFSDNEEDTKSKSSLNSKEKSGSIFTKEKHREDKNEKPKKSVKKSKHKNSSRSSSSTLSSSRSVEDLSPENMSRSASLKNLEEEYTCLDPSIIPLNVYQSLLSIKSSMINVYKLRKEYDRNNFEIENSNNYLEVNQELEKKKEELSDEIIKELSSLLSLNRTIFGNTHWKLAWNHINLALCYLELKNLPKQAKEHCEKAWEIYLEDLRQEQINHLTDSEYETERQFLDQNSEQHHMVLNYVYGRSCTLLKENEEGKESLENAKEHLENIESENKRISNLETWRTKIFLALAKQYAILKSFRDAVDYYEAVIDEIRSSENNQNKRLLVQVYNDMAKIELAKDNSNKAVDMLKESLKIAEEIGSENLVVECKLNLSRTLSELDVVNDLDKAELLIKEILELSSNSSRISKEKYFEIKDEMIKFHLKQEKFEKALKLLSETVKEKIDHYTEFSLKLNSSYKLLCSIYLKRNDMENAVKYLQKSYELEKLNYGSKNKKTLDTKEKLDNFSKNPLIKTKLNASKPTFLANKRIDYTKEDKSLYSNETKTDQNSDTTSNKQSINDSTLNTSVLKKMTPLK